MTLGVSGVAALQSCVVRCVDGAVASFGLAVFLRAMSSNKLHYLCFCGFKKRSEVLFPVFVGTLLQLVNDANHHVFSVRVDANVSLVGHSNTASVCLGLLCPGSAANAPALAVDRPFIKDCQSID